MIRSIADPSAEPKSTAGWSRAKAAIGVVSPATTACGRATPGAGPKAGSSAQCITAARIVSACSRDFGRTCR